MLISHTHTHQPPARVELGYTNSNELPLEVSNVDDVKPLVLTFLWVKFDINHLLETAVLSPLPHCTCPQLTSQQPCVWTPSTCNYRGFLSIVTQQLQASRQFNVSVFQVSRGRTQLHTPDDAVFSYTQAGLCRY